MVDEEQGRMGNQDEPELYLMSLTHFGFGLPFWADAN